MSAALKIDPETEKLSEKPRLGEKRPKPRLVWVNPKLSHATHKEYPKVKPNSSYGRVLYNYYRTYDPSTGRYITSDPIGLLGGLNTYLYAKANPLSLIDKLGLSSGPGGPWHPPVGVTVGCKGNDDCPTLKKKMWIINKMLDSHAGWDAHQGGGRHAQEIDDLLNALAKCEALYEEKCKNPNPNPGPAPAPLPSCGNDCQQSIVKVVAGVVITVIINICTLGAAGS